jgi:hypothetical protein
MTAKAIPTDATKTNVAGKVSAIGVGSGVGEGVGVGAGFRFWTEKKTGDED